MIVFDPSTPNIQGKLDTIFAQQEPASSAPSATRCLFKPGTYNGFNAQIGFYTSIVGLGQNPDDVTINGDVTVDAGWFDGNATQNFWRSAENLSIYPVGGTNRWAVSQAAPFRRMHVKGDLNLAPNGYGWASGGYIADSRIDGTVGPYSQQQWYTRDSSVGGWRDDRTRRSIRSGRWAFPHLPALLALPACPAYPCPAFPLSRFSTFSPFGSSTSVKTAPKPLTIAGVAPLVPGTKNKPSVIRLSTGVNRRGALNVLKVVA